MFYFQVVVESDWALLAVLPFDSFKVCWIGIAKDFAHEPRLGIDINNNDCRVSRFIGSDPKIGNVIMLQQGLK